MTLTKRKALTESIKIWKKLAETGKTKQWYNDNVEHILVLYHHGCPLCNLYNKRHTATCPRCPLRHCYVGSLYANWEDADITYDRKKYAKQLLTILRKALRELDKKKK